jgi:hypothetical protein
MLEACHSDISLVRGGAETYLPNSVELFKIKQIKKNMYMYSHSPGSS